MILTYRYRIKDSSSRRHLARHARAVNYVWNYLCETQRHAQKWRRQWPSAYDFMKLCAGSSVELNLQADSIDEICKVFVRSRMARRRCPRFRSSRKSVGWIPFKANTVQTSPGGVTYRKRCYRLWESRDMTGKLKTGTLSADARGRWYVNFQCEIAEQPLGCGGEIGIDLGLKDLAVLSNGERIENPRIFRSYETRLAIAQRAGNKRRAQAIHAKIANARKDFLHKETTKLVRTYGKIVVGDVNAGRLTRTRFAKSVSDAGWSMFRNMLRFKAVKHGALFVEADERWSSTTCSSCGARSGPKGRKGLCVRQWVCDECGSVHDRDQNAAVNILAAGAECRPPSVGIAA